ncbi:acyltransferase [Vibrio crassostreae]|uniref:acyltransferase n=1 Tax=Vibrio crassostreae TaxID=246167 RepID=UPI001B30E18D|nr:acyltransferase [Vibrio crassostreae]
MKSFWLLIKKFRKLVLQIFIFRGNALFSIKNNIFSPSFIRKSRKADITFVGRRVYIGYSCHVGTNVTIGSDVMIASQVSFVGGDHSYNNMSIPMFDSERPLMKGVVLEDDTWIGHGAVILDGVTVSHGSIVGAGSVVTKTTQPYSIVAGNPAKIIKFRN